MSVTPEDIRATADRYVAALNAGDLEAIMGIYADDATVEDPVGGGKVLSGTEQIREFYSTVTALDCEAKVHQVRVCGSELLFNFELTTRFDADSAATIDVWDLMVHDDEGKVTSMKAYWGPENMS